MKFKNQTGEVFYVKTIQQANFKNHHWFWIRTQESLRQMFRVTRLQKSYRKSLFWKIF